MKRQFILFISLLCCLSCVSQKKEIIVKSTIKLEGKNTNIRDLIEIDGYYYMSEYPDSNCRMFFEDGLYVDQFHFKKDLSENEIKANLTKSIHIGVEKRHVSWGFFWGVYKIVEDTLVVYKYLRGSFWTPWYFVEERYKVVDSKTIQRIYQKDLLKCNGDYDPCKVHDNFYFTSADSLPSSNNWLKEEKWIWRNEQDWKDYMEKIKKLKKK